MAASGAGGCKSGRSNYSHRSVTRLRRCCPAFCVLDCAGCLDPSPYWQIEVLWPVEVLYPSLPKYLTSSLGGLEPKKAVRMASNAIRPLQRDKLARQSRRKDPPKRQSTLNGTRSEGKEIKKTNLPPNDVVPEQPRNTGLLGRPRVPLAFREAPRRRAPSGRLGRMHARCRRDRPVRPRFRRRVRRRRPSRNVGPLGPREGVVAEE